LPRPADPLEHRVELLIGKDKMVKDLYAKQFSRGPKAFGDIAVVVAWQEIPAGVVVGDYDSGGTFA